MANTFKFGNGQWAVGKETALAYNDENSNFKPLPFSFDRASTATVVNKNGLIETVGVDEPRIDFLNNTKGHLLLEPQRTNLFSNSNLFTSWSKEATVTLTPNYGISPDGTQNSTRMQMSANDSIYVSTTSGLTASVYVKGVQGETIRLSNGSSVIHTLTGQWDRIEVYDSGSSSTLMTINTYLGATARDVELFGAQREAGSYATSYIPTSGSAVTRSADSTVQTVPDGVIGQTEGTLYYHLGNIPNQAIDDVFVELSDGTSNNRILIYVDDLGRIRNQIKASASISSLINTNVNLSSNLKMAITYKTNEAKVFINGVQYGGTDTSVVVPSVSKITLSNYSGVRAQTSTTREVKLYDTALSDSELQALTS